MIKITVMLCTSIFFVIIKLYDLTSQALQNQQD